MEKKKRWLPWSAKKRDDQELEELRKKISEKPDDPRLHQRLGELLLEKGRKMEAMEALLKAGDCHAEAGFHLRAIAVYRRVLRMEESPRVMLKLAEIYLANGFLGDALVQYKALIHYYRERGKAEEILGILKRMPQVAQGNREVRLKCVELLAQEGYMEEAFEEMMKLYLEVVEGGDRGLKDMLQPRLRELGEKVKGMWEKQGKANEAFNLQQKLYLLLQEEVLPLPDVDAGSGSQVPVAALPGAIEERLEEARVYEEHGLFEEAEEIYKAILEFAPECIEALEGLNRTAMEKARLAKSETPGGHVGIKEVEDQQRAISRGETGPGQGTSDPRSHLDIGVAYMELGLLDEAAEAFRMASNDPKTAFSAYRGLGECFKRKGELQEAARCLKKALSFKGVPTRALLEVGYELGRILELQGKRKEALTLYRKMLEVNSGFRDIGERIKALSD